MLILALFSWWYTVGWAQLVRRAASRIVGVLDFFSVGMLFKSLFAPFRQISVGRVQGSLDTKIRAWADLQISRLIGAMVRLAVIAFGLIAVIVMVVASAGLVLLWPIVPVAPFIVLAIMVGLS